MGSCRLKLGLLFVVAISLSGLFEVCKASFNPTIHEYIENELKNKINPGTSLTIHCHSKDDNLGEHQVFAGQPFTWSFKRDFFGRTHFWCDAGWVDMDGHVVHKTFDVYNGKELDLRKCKNCHWQARDDGGYLNNELMWSWEY